MLLIPYVQSAGETQDAVAATQYPPDGVRGVSALTHATRFGRIEGYARRAGEEICLLVQIETQRVLDDLEQIAAVEDAVRRIRACGKPAGIPAPDPAFARRCIGLGTLFMAVGVDVGILARSTERLAQEFRANAG